MYWNMDYSKVVETHRRDEDGTLIRIDYSIRGDSDYFLLPRYIGGMETVADWVEVGDVVRFGPYEFKLIHYEPANDAWIALRLHRFNLPLFYLFRLRGWWRLTEIRIIKTLCVWGFGRIPYMEQPSWEHITWRPRPHSMRILLLVLWMILVLD